MVTEPRLSTRNLGKRYGQVVVLDSVSVDFAPASLVAVTGPNGAGKSTFLACLAGVIGHTGVVLVNSAPACPGTIAYLPQRVQFPANVLVGEVLDLFGGGSGVPDGFIPDRGRKISELSGGQRRRVAVAASLGSEAEVVLLDEPLANLDDHGRAEVVAILDSLRARGTTVVVASPTVVDLLTMVDRVLVVAAGGITFDGPAGRYFAGIKTGIWVRGTLPEVSELIADRRAVGEWQVLSCREDQAAELISTLLASGVAPSDIRLGGPDEGSRPGSGPEA